MVCSHWLKISVSRLAKECTVVLNGAVKALLTPKITLTAIVTSTKAAHLVNIAAFLQ